MRTFIEFWSIVVMIMLSVALVTSKPLDSVTGNYITEADGLDVSLYSGTYFDTNGVSEAIEMDWGDSVEFNTRGTWKGVIVLEYSSDNGQLWRMLYHPVIFSANDTNVQFDLSLFDNEQNIDDLKPGHYRWNMLKMRGGRCCYSWFKRVRP